MRNCGGRPLNRARAKLFSRGFSGVVQHFSGWQTCRVYNRGCEWFNANYGGHRWTEAHPRSSWASRVRVWPKFGKKGQILFQRAEDGANYLEQFDAEGKHLSKVLPYPISDFQSISPSRKWVIASGKEVGR